MFSGPFSESIIKRAIENNLCSIALHDIRAYATDKHHTCDDTPYGGGGGMMMKPEPIFRSIETVLSQPTGWVLPNEDAYVNLPEWDLEARSSTMDSNTPIILLTPQGRPLTQSVAQELSQHDRLALLCGRYEGVDDRVRSQLVTDEISIGDYVLSGGELAAMVLIDAMIRLLPGALGHALGAWDDSHSSGMNGLLEGPQYTRPPIFRDEAIPETLTSGHHANVNQWRREQSLLRTLQRRPDLIEKATLSAADQKFIAEHHSRLNNIPPNENV